MLTPVQMAAHRARVTTPERRGDDDRAYWQSHIGSERLIWTGRPEQGFRISAKGHWWVWGTLVLSALALVFLVTFTGHDLMWLIMPFLLAANALGWSMALLRARLDQTNREARRYAITPTHALAVRNIHEGRPRALPLGPDTKIVLYPEAEHAHGTFKIRDDSDGYAVLALANRDAEGTVTGSIQFERLTKDQVSRIVDILRRNGLAA